MISQPIYTEAVTNDEPFKNLSIYTFNQTDANVTNSTEPKTFLNATIWRILWMAHPNVSQICQAVTLSCITLIGILGNFVLILSSPRIVNVNRNLLAIVTSIALCDILVCMTLPYDVYLIVTYDNDLERLHCTFQGIIITFPGLLKNFNMVQISLLCYMMVWNPTKRFKIQKRLCVNLSVVLAWCMAVSFGCLPFYWYNNEEYDSNTPKCDLENLWSLGYKMLYLFQFLFTSLFYGNVILFVQCGIHKLKAKLELNSRRRRRKKLTSETKRKNHIQQAVAFSITASIMFMMTLPYHAVILVHFLLGMKIIPELFIVIFYYLSILHVIVNPILYACHIRKMTGAYLGVARNAAKFLCCKCCRYDNPGPPVSSENNGVRLHTMSLRRPVSGSMLRLHTSLDGRGVGIPRVVVTDFDQSGRRVDADWTLDGSDIWCSSGVNDFHSEEINCTSSYDFSCDTFLTEDFLDVPDPE